MLEMWSNFVKYLNPTPPDSQSEALANVTWTPVTADNHQYLRYVGMILIQRIKYMLHL